MLMFQHDTPFPPHQLHLELFGKDGLRDDICSRFIIKGLYSKMLKVWSCCDSGIWEKDLFPLPWNEFSLAWATLTKKCQLIISVEEAFPADLHPADCHLVSSRLLDWQRQGNGLKEGEMSVCTCDHLSPIIHFFYFFIYIQSWTHIHACKPACLHVWLWVCACMWLGFGHHNLE